jgi:hypothetical protein
LGSSETISKVVKIAADSNYVGNRFAWFALTKVRKKSVEVNFEI